ncbi:NAD-dependent epimerase [Actinomadura barringtoniae]|uniref:NAD-dependent epimerase n=1 Tax=Actinomadura barringtoniae TaxID=1427535 RepID=A0A939PAK4_9ACTN|nr:NAD-dependent epimerase [Actinomadura barringtoniae]MBO2448888.1 NAD-dependent epimerase [Actinomadura barringtoniae]
MPFHVIVGRGATAHNLAKLLTDAGDRVTMVSRSGEGPGNVERVALDAGETDRLTDLAQGADTLFNLAMPAYHTWPETVPPLFGSIQTAAERTDATYVMLSNLYGYGPVEGTLTEDHPLAATGPKGKVRAQMWLNAKAAHDAGRIRVTEIRAGQFIGAGAFSIFNAMVQPKVLAGLLALVPAAVDVPHSFTSVDDAAAALYAVAHDERALGQAWHAPMVVHSVREMAERLADLADAPPPRVEEMSDRELTLLGNTAPIWEELWETHHMSHRPFVVDSTRITDTFGVKPTPLDETLKASLTGTDDTRALTNA